MRTIAKITLLGIVGNTPETRTTKGGMAVTSFPLATNIKRKSPNGDAVEATLWHNCVCFGRAAENAAKYIVKGSKLYADGTIDYQEYQDSNNTQKLSTKIIVQDFSVLTKSEQSVNGNMTSRQSSAESKSNMDDSDFPF